MGKIFSDEEKSDILERFSAYWQEGQKTPFDREELLFLENYFLETGQVEKLQRVYDLGIALFPSDFHFLFGKAYWTIRYEAPVSSRAILEYLEGEFPEYFETCFLRFLWWAVQGQKKKARKILSGCVKEFAPLPPDTARMVLESFDFLGYTEISWVKTLFDHTRKEPKTVRYFYFRFLDRGIKFKDIDVVFKKLEQYFPEDVEVKLRYAEYLKNRDIRSRKAEKLLKEVLDINPDQSTAHLLLAEIYEAKALYAVAIYHYLRVLDTQDPSAGIFMRLGVCHEKIGDTSKAAEFYRLAVYEDPAYLPAWHALVQIPLQRKDYDEALRVNLEAIENIPNVKLMESLGYIYLKKQRMPSALKAYEEAFRMGSRNKNLLLVLHDLYKQSGLDDKAGEILRLANELYRDDPDIQQRLNSGE